LENIQLLPLGSRLTPLLRSRRPKTLITRESFTLPAGLAKRLCPPRLILHALILIQEAINSNQISLAKNPILAIHGVLTKKSLVNPKEKIMKPSTEDRTEGKLHEVKGAIKESVGEATGDPNLEDSGNAEKIGGKAQKWIGHVEKVVGA
jgi:uncharacterized protein YjbJ (UPF0337 family)